MSRPDPKPWEVAVVGLVLAVAGVAILAVVWACVVVLA